MRCDLELERPLKWDSVLAVAQKPAESRSIVQGKTDAAASAKVRPYGCGSDKSHCARAAHAEQSLVTLDVVSLRCRQQVAEEPTAGVHTAAVKAEPQSLSSTERIRRTARAASLPDQQHILQGSKRSAKIKTEPLKTEEPEQKDPLHENRALKSVKTEAPSPLQSGAAVSASARSKRSARAKVDIS